VTRHWMIAGFAALGLVLNAWSLQDAFIEPRAVLAAADARPVRVVSFNVNVGNADSARIASYLGSLSPDVVVLEEVTAANAERLGSLLTRLPHRHAGMWGVVIFSRWPLIPTRRIAPEGSFLRAPVDVDLGDRRLRLHALHLHWPLVPKSAEIRNSQLMWLGRELAACEGACIAVGDFNTTPWSSHFRGLVKVSGHQDCAAGRGLLPTWPSGLPAFLRIRIDHCLASADVSVADLLVGKPHK
jgi:endonuclease/exonuclease/phosphatase (EEP) superfamily protein YafD